MTAKLSARKPHACTRPPARLAGWIDRLRAQYGDDFPEKVTAFRPDMAVHGKYRQPCPVCGTAVQRIRYADNETNYCRAVRPGVSCLLIAPSRACCRKDWPRTIPIQAQAPRTALSTAPTSVRRS